MGNTLEQWLGELGQIGFQAGVGTTRLPYTPEYDRGREYVRRRMEQVGLETRIDPVGNLCGLLPGEGPRICIGSHIDTVPGGGIYDGAYGVLAALDCIRRLREAGWQNRHPLELVAFTEEEGNVIGGTFGSKAFAGSALDAAMAARLPQYGLSLADVAACRRRPEDYLCYLELHIEQGGILEAEQTQIGVAGGIVGILRYRAAMQGAANHAGSTPMPLRDDALEKTCRLIVWLMEQVRTSYPEMVCTVGTLQVSPGAVNVIPGRTEFVIELRDRSMEAMDQMAACLLEQFGGAGLSMEEMIRQPPTLCDPSLLQMTRDCCGRLGYTWRDMFSGAGHDLINMARLAPSLLVFIPSKNGVSHRIDEYSAPEDLERGSRVLLELIQATDQINQEGCSP